MHSSLKHKESVQARSTTIHNRLAIQKDHSITKNKKRPGMIIKINAIETCTDIPECMTIEEYRL